MNSVIMNIGLVRCILNLKYKVLSIKSIRCFHELCVYEYLTYMIYFIFNKFNHDNIDVNNIIVTTEIIIDNN